MKLEQYFVFCVSIILTGSSQTRGQSSTALPLTEISTSPELTEDPDHETLHWTHSPSGREETSTETTITGAGVHPETVKSEAFQTASVTVATSPHTDIPVVTSANPATATASAPTGSLSSTPGAQSSTPPQHIHTTEGSAPLTTDPLTTFSSPPAHTVQDSGSTTHASAIQRQNESLTTASTQHTSAGLPLTSSAPGRAPAGPTHKEVPSELNVGDEDHKQPRSSSPLDPLLAGLLSVFIVTTAIVFIVLFLKFRQRTNHPEFHRLQDLPMDDLMEDTPLSRYSY
ncbi:uncharacterized protein LOC141803803 [Halichoeres trimaculatus]|uniref:uncharacterized protein LOC141803803 n=1 Tax=Halichoeres trimaculatus TaxID=147232 RepID=UPI003D9F73D1